MTQPGPSPLASGDEISVDAAAAAIAGAIKPIDQTETVGLGCAAGRILAADLVSPIAVPAHDNSAMDGYAFDGAQLTTDQPLTLQCLGTVYAGRAPGLPVASGHCVRIMTGAVMPAGLDTVVPLELCRDDGARVQLAPNVVRRGEHRRRAGEDLAEGGVALAAGRRLRAADIGLIASLGLTQVQVLRRPKIALFSTGDEVVAPGSALPAGSIYDSNRFSLQAALQRLGMEVLDYGLVADDPLQLQATLERAVGEADAVVTSGGVSAGDADHTRDVLARMGQVDFWKVAMRPGRPFAFGPLHHRGRSAWLFALPGNPVAALVTFYVFARPSLLQLAGARPEPLPLLRVRSTAPIRKRTGRSEYQRAIVEPGADGRMQARLTGAQGAGILRSMSLANALIVLGPDQGSVQAGDEVEVWLFEGLAA